MSLVNLSRLAWRTQSRDTSVHGTKGRLERARSTVLQGQDRRAPFCIPRSFLLHGAHTVLHTSCVELAPVPSFFGRPETCVLCAS